jgi:uncharacterized lipoprotein YehR (DUF1307 family)
MRLYRLAVLAAAAIVAVSLSGCGSKSGDTSSPTATAGSSGLYVEVGNTINFGGSGVTTEIDCTDGKSLNVGLNDNTLTVKGACAEVRVGGSNNSITLNQVDTLINVAGTNNKITYKTGDPKVEKLGDSNKISKG